MNSNTATELKYNYDIVAWLLNVEYCCVTAPLKNTLGATVSIADVIGTPLNLNGAAYELAAATGEAGVDGIVIGKADDAPQGPISIANNASTPDSYLILVRGPGIIVRDGISAKDEADADFDLDALETRLKALDILVKDQPAASVTEEMPL